MPLVKKEDFANGDIRSVLCRRCFVDGSESGRYSHVNADNEKEIEEVNDLNGLDEIDLK